MPPPPALTTATLPSHDSPRTNQEDIPSIRSWTGQRGEFDAGLLIHEGQITYQAEGFNKIVDFGELWQRMYELPLPLGLDVVRKDVGEEMARKLSLGLRQSIHFGYTHQKDSIPYALQYGRGINEDLGARFVKMYVSELTIDMGESGRKALELLFKLGSEGGAIPAIRY
jgi:1,4-dihydroxy-6-naphthoate synthase